MEIKLIPVKWWVDKYIKAHAYYRIVFTIKIRKFWFMYNKDESQKKKILGGK